MINEGMFFTMTKQLGQLHDHALKAKDRSLDLLSKLEGLLENVIEEEANAKTVRHMRYINDEVTDKINGILEILEGISE